MAWAGVLSLADIHSAQRSSISVFKREPQGQSFSVKLKLNMTGVAAHAAVPTRRRKKLRLLNVLLVSNLPTSVLSGNLFDDRSRIFFGLERGILGLRSGGIKFCPVP